MKVRGHRVFLEETDGLWEAYVPSLPGCFMIGPTRNRVVLGIVKLVAERTNEKRPEPRCTCIGFLGKPDGCPAHGRIETRLELEELRGIKAAAKDLTWKMRDGIDRAEGAIVDRAGWDHLIDLL